MNYITASLNLTYPIVMYIKDKWIYKVDNKQDVITSDGSLSALYCILCIILAKEAMHCMALL